MRVRDKIYLLKIKTIRYLKDVLNVIVLKSDKHVNLPRYQKGEDNLLGKTVFYPDYLAYKNCKDEIFGLNIYNFGNVKTPYIIDCGSNIGLSIIKFKSEYPDAIIHAFEADINIFEYLKKNLESFSLQDVSIKNYALWDQDGVVLFDSEGADSGRVHGLTNNLINNNKKEVKTTKLSDYINKKVDFLKIDIEGAETRVLREISNKLFLVNRMYIEYHSFHDQPQTLNEILTILSSNGFRYYINSALDLSKNPFESIVLNNGMDNQLNIFAYK